MKKVKWFNSKKFLVCVLRSNLCAQLSHGWDLADARENISPWLYQIWITMPCEFSYYLTWECVDTLHMCFMHVCNPWISFTWHPHGRHYMNICELHLEAFLHVKCLAVSLLQGEGPFAVTNQVSLLHLHSDTTKKRVQPQTANVGKALC